MANKKLIANNNKAYCWAKLAGGMVADCEEISPLVETASWTSGYFWRNLYKPYPDVPSAIRRSSGMIEKMFKELMPLFISGNEITLQDWIKFNRSLMKLNLPDFEDDSVLVALLKIHYHLMQGLSPLCQMISAGLKGDVHRFESMLMHWRQFFAQLMTDFPPKQLNISDLKGLFGSVTLLEARRWSLLNPSLSIQRH